MSEINVKHQGFKITFAENEEIWRCWDLGFENKSLAKLKSAINKHVGVTLKNLSPDIGLVTDWSNRVTRAAIIGRDNKSGKFWVVKAGEQRRTQEDPKTMVPWSPELEKTLEEAAVIEAQGHALLKQADAVRKRIKPLSGEELDEFIAGLMKSIKPETE